MNEKYRHWFIPMDQKFTIEDIINRGGYYDIDGVWNSILRIDGELLRGRVEVLILDEDKIFLQMKDDGTYRIPGGSFEKGVFNKDQAAAEAREEARINCKNVSYSGVNYIRFFDKKYKQEPGKVYWSGTYNEVYVAEYDGQYHGKINDIDKDDNMFLEGKFYPLSMVAAKLKNPHQEALKDIIRDVMINQSHSTSVSVNVQESAKKIQEDDNFFHLTPIEENAIIKKENIKYYPYFTPEQMESIGVFRESGNFYSDTAEIDNYTKDWYQRYKMQKDLSVSSDWYTKLKHEYEEYTENPSDEAKQKILSLGWNPEIPVTIENIKKVADLREKENTPEKVIKLQENYIFSKKDNVYNFDKWENGERNILFITGHSGSGKSTLAFQLAKEYEATVIQLDHIQCYEKFMKCHKQSDTTKLIKKYLKKNKDLKASDFDNILLKSFQEIYNEMFPWLLKELEKDKDTLYIIEGVHIMLFTKYKDIKEYPLICINTSMSKSMFRHWVRDQFTLKELIMYGPADIVLFKNWEDQYNDFKNDIENESYIINPKEDDNMILESKYPEEVPQDIINLLRQLNSYDYGFVKKNGEKVKGMKNFFEDYRSLTISEFEKYKIGVCWDYVHYEADWFKKHKYRYETFYIQVQDEDNDCPSHTYLVFYLPNSRKVFYFESSWGKYQGIEAFNNINQLHNTIKDRHIKNAKSKCDPKTYFRERYNAESKSWEHLGCGEYMVKISKGRIKLDESYIEESSILGIRINKDKLNDEEYVKDLIKKINEIPKEEYKTKEHIKVWMMILSFIPSFTIIGIPLTRLMFKIIDILIPACSSREDLNRLEKSIDDIIKKLNENKKKASKDEKDRIDKNIDKLNKSKQLIKNAKTPKRNRSKDFKVIVPIIKKYFNEEKYSKIKRGIDLYGLKDNMKDARESFFNGEDDTLFIFVFDSNNIKDKSEGLNLLKSIVSDINKEIKKNNYQLYCEINDGIKFWYAIKDLNGYGKNISYNESSGILDESVIEESDKNSGYKYRKLTGSNDIDEFFKYNKELLNDDTRNKEIIDKCNIKKIYFRNKFIGYIGLTSYHSNKDNMNYLGIRNFMILPEYQKMGHGTNIINDIVEKNKEKYNEIFCWVEKDNAEAIKFYQKIADVDTRNLIKNKLYYVRFYYNYQNESVIEEEMKRSELPDDVFGIPQERKYPMPDEKHVRSAIKLFNHVEPKYEKQLAKKIIANMKKYNIDASMVGDKNRLKQYLPKTICDYKGE